MNKNFLTAYYIIFLLTVYFLITISCKEKKSENRMTKEQLKSTIWEGERTSMDEKDIYRFEFRANDSVGVFLNSYSDPSDKYYGYDNGNALEWHNYNIINDSILRIEKFLFNDSSNSYKSQDFIFSEDGNDLEAKMVWGILTLYKIE